MNKNAILTFHYVFNYGAFLQAYAQSKLLHADILDVVRFEPNKKNVKYKIFLNYQTTYLPLTEKKLVSMNEEEWIDFINSFGYETIYFGSDVILSACETSFLYLLDERIKATKIICAASANKFAYLEKSPQYLKEMKRRLSTFSKIGVRDVYTEQLMKALDTKCVKVPDPTIAYDFSNEIEDIKLPFKKKLGLSFIHKRNPDIFNSLVSFFPDYTSIGIRVPNKLAKHQFPELTPFSWISTILQLDVLITDSFHHAIFAIKYNVPVICCDGEASSSNISKMEDLLQDLDLSYCYIRDKENINDKVSNILSSWDDEKNQKKLLLLKQKYLSFIQ